MVRRWFAALTQSGQDDALLVRELASRHLLLVPSTVRVEDVAYLLRARLPDSDLTADGEVSLGRHSRLSGPYELELEDAVEAHVPLPWTVCYALECPVEREAPPLRGVDDRDGFAYAFSEGLPWRDEGRSLQLLVSLARRMHGAVRTTSPYRMIQPDPMRAVDYVIRTPHTIDPEALEALVRRTVPQARLAVDGAEWFGPTAEIYSGAPVIDDIAADPLSPDDLHELHASADSVDIQMLAQESVLDAFAVVADLGAHGSLEVLVHWSEDGEPSVVAQDWAHEGYLTYEVRWCYPDMEQHERRFPSEHFLDARDRARPVVDAVARDLLEVTHGVAVDEDGFWLDRYHL